MIAKTTPRKDIPKRGDIVKTVKYHDKDHTMAVINFNSGKRVIFYLAQPKPKEEMKFESDKQQSQDKDGEYRNTVVETIRRMDEKAEEAPKSLSELAGGNTRSAPPVTSASSPLTGMVAQHQAQMQQITGDANADYVEKARALLEHCEDRSNKISIGRI